MTLTPHDRGDRTVKSSRVKYNTACYLDFMAQWCPSVFGLCNVLVGEKFSGSEYEFS